MNRRRFLTSAAAAALVVALLSGCREEPANKPAIVHSKETTQHPGPRMGYRITPKGGLGFEIAPGIVMGFDGRIGPGVGF